MPAVHQFGSTVEAYTSVNTGVHWEIESGGNEVKVENGDVLVVASEGIVGFACEAWPVAIVFPGWDGKLGVVSEDGDEDVHPPTGAFHWTTPANDDPEHPLNKYKESVKLAVDTAQADADITGNEHWAHESGEAE